MSLKGFVTRRGVVVVGVWAVLNAGLAALQFAFHSNSDVMERSFYWSSVGLLVLLAAALAALPRRAPRTAPVPARPRGGQTRNGAPSAALAAACMLGGLAWVFGIYVAYLALPLLAFCLARWRAEWAQRRSEEAGR